MENIRDEDDIPLSRLKDMMKNGNMKTAINDFIKLLETIEPVK